MSNLIVTAAPCRIESPVTGVIESGGFSVECERRSLHLLDAQVATDWKTGEPLVTNGGSAGSREKCNMFRLLLADRPFAEAVKMHWNAREKRMEAVFHPKFGFRFQTGAEVAELQVFVKEGSVPLNTSEGLVRALESARRFVVCEDDETLLNVWVSKAAYTATSPNKEGVRYIRHRAALNIGQLARAAATPLRFGNSSGPLRLNYGVRSVNRW